MAETQAKIFLWAVPRSISTAFCRAMMNKPDTKVFIEPFINAYYFGSERISKRYQNEPVKESCTFKDIKTILEQDYPGHKTVFVKDMAYYLFGRPDTITYLPENYTHTFLLRNPEKSIHSLYRMSTNKELAGWDYFDAQEVGFRELYQMYELVTDTLGQDAIIVDADDLLKDPELMLRTYCSKVGITFDEKMLNWKDIPEDSEIFHEWKGWFKELLNSKTFLPYSGMSKSTMSEPALSEHVQEVIDESMFYYNKMYSNRIIPAALNT